MPYKFSPSSLSLLKDCPRCFWLEFNKKIGRPKGIFPSLPSGMDGIIKLHFDSYRSRGEVPPEISELDGIALFDDTALLKEWRNNFHGIRWTDSDGNLFHGAVDEILKKGSKLIVLDYKTRGYAPKEETAGYYQDQLDIYNLLLRKNGRETEDYGYLLIYHPDRINENGDVLFHKNLVKVKISVNNAERIFENALTVLGGPMPDASKDCDYCNWAVESR